MREIPDHEFRAAGKTGAARNFPLSEAGCEWLAAFNGLTVEQMPRAWRFASNEYMRAAIEQRAYEIREAARQPAGPCPAVPGNQQESK